MRWWAEIEGEVTTGHGPVTGRHAHRHSDTGVRWALACWSERSRERAHRASDPPLRSVPQPPRGGGMRQRQHGTHSERGGACRQLAWAWAPQHVSPTDPLMVRLASARQGARAQSRLVLAAACRALCRFSRAKQCKSALSASGKPRHHHKKVRAPIAADCRDGGHPGPRGAHGPAVARHDDRRGQRRNPGSAGPGIRRDGALGFRWPLRGRGVRVFAPGGAIREGRPRWRHLAARGKTVRRASAGAAEGCGTRSLAPHGDVPRSAHRHRWDP